MLRLNRTVLHLSGPDARPFLQNLVTQDLDRLDREIVVYSGLLSPQGKVQADFFIWGDGASLWLDADAARGPDLLRRLTMFKLRADVNIEDRTADCGLYATREAPPPGAKLSAPDPRLPALGLRTLTTILTASDDPTDYHARRIAEGAPDLVIDADPEEVFALEALFEELHGVDFKKGCFVGQENVSRMKRRATTRKKFCRIAFDGPPPAPRTPILAGSAEIGSVRSGIEGRAIALLRLDRALEAREQGLTAGGRAVHLDPPAWLLMPDAHEGA